MRRCLIHISLFLCALQVHANDSTSIVCRQSSIVVKNGTQTLHALSYAYDGTTGNLTSRQGVNGTEQENLSTILLKPIIIMNMQIITAEE